MMYRQLKALAFVLVLSVASTSYADVFTLNPATEEEELVLISTAREISMGRRLDRKVRAHFDKPVDPEVRERVQRIGRDLAEHAERREIVYHFEVLASDEDGDMYNAFAAPGGYVYIFEDLVDLLDTDDELAAVLAHEMGHIEARHSVKRMQASWGVTALLVLGSQMRSEQGAQARAHTAIGQMMAAYSREDEKQADELSVMYLERAGYDTEASLTVLKRLRDLRMEGPIRRYVYFRSHPFLSERIAHLRQHIRGYMDFDTYINLPPDGERPF